MFCIHCGKQIEEGDRFCEFCGKIQEIAPETGTVPGAGQTEVQQAAVQPQTVYVQQPEVQVTVQPAAAQPAGAVGVAPKKKKPPVALFIILGILFFAGLAIAIAVIIFVAIMGSKIKDARQKLERIQNIDPNTVLEENGFYEFYEDSSGQTEKESEEKPSVSEEESEGSDIEQGVEVGPEAEEDVLRWEGVDRPELYDFDWRDDADFRYSDSNVKWLDASQYQGEWKGMIIYSSDGSEELVNFDLEITPDEATMVADWYMVHIGGNELMPEEDIDDTVFTGYEFGNGIHVESQNATIEINEFWELDGTQYGIGRLILQGSKDNEVFLIRP